VSVFKIHKVIGSLPASVDPDCLYLVRTGAGFDLYVSDTTGAVAHALNGGSATGGISDLLSVPLARQDHFEYTIVVQDGELRRMSFSDFNVVTDPGFVPPVLHPDGLMYDTDYVVYDEYVLIYPDEGILCYSDEILYYGEEKLEYYSI